MSKVFVVMGGFEYEGMDDNSVKVFSDKVSAENYGESLVSEDVCPYHYYEVKELEVE